MKMNVMLTENLIHRICIEKRGALQDINAENLSSWTQISHELSIKAIVIMQACKGMVLHRDCNLPETTIL